jgi:multidrug efflux pump subunit AcrA (membrane-fusion protein)
VVAPNITEVERKLIRIGMTAKIDVAIQNPPAIKLPLQAVTQENGMNYVTLVDTKDNKQRKVAVQVGDSDVTQIAILSGISQRCCVG